MKKAIAVVVIVLSLALANVAAANTGPQYNVDPGGGGCTSSCYYIARVYIPYNGYWHWVNCEFFNFGNGLIVQGRCW